MMDVVALGINTFVALVLVGGSIVYFTHPEETTELLSASPIDDMPQAPGCLKDCGQEKEERDPVRENRDRDRDDDDDDERDGEKGKGKGKRDRDRDDD